MRTQIGTERNATASESRPRRFHSRFISHKTAGSVHSTRRRATRGAGNRDASRPPPSNASHAATIARRDDQASPARVQTRGAHRLSVNVFARDSLVRKEAETQSGHVSTMRAWVNSSHPSFSSCYRMYRSRRGCVESSPLFGDVRVYS